MKKTLKLSAITASVLATTVLLTSTAFAHGYKGEANYKGEAAPCPPAERGLQSGFYLGAQGGYDSYRIKNNINLGSGLLTSNPTTNATGFVGGLFAGYGAYFSDFYYLGLEVLGNYSNASSNTSLSTSGTINASTMTANTNAYGTWGVSVLPGLKLNNDSLLYVRLGYDWTRIKNSVSNTSSVTGLTEGSASTNNWTGGFNYGLGIETLIFQNWSMRTEYSHTNYNNYTASYAGNTVKFNPANNQFMVGVLYHFA